MNTITIEWSAEDRARIDTLIEKLDKLTSHDCSKCVDSAIKYVAAMLGHSTATPATEAEPTVNPTEEEKPAAGQETAKTEPQPEPEPVKVDLADIQNKVVALSNAGKKAEVKEIVTKYADRVSKIPEDKRAEVLAQLTKLEG